jgi:cytoskeletal protein RodZ
MKQCPACHRAYDDTEFYCLMDGTLLKTERKKSSSLFLLSGLIVLGIIGLGGFFLLKNFTSKENSGDNRKQIVEKKSPTQKSSPVLSPTSVKNQNSIAGKLSTENETNTSDSPAQPLIDGEGSSFDNPQEITSESVVLRFKGDNGEQFFVFEGEGDVHISFEIKAQSQNAGANVSFMDADGNSLAQPVLIQAMNSGTERVGSKFNLSEKQKVVMKVTSIAYGTGDAYPGTLKIIFKSGFMGERL